MACCRRSWWAALVLVAGTACAGAAIGSTASAQIIEINTKAERDGLYELLGREVDELERRGNILKTVVKLVGPTVVHIEADTPVQDSAGSGVIAEIAGRPYVVTNRHVVADAELEEINVHLADGRTARPIRRWEDPNTDVGVLEVDVPDLVTCRLGDSDKVEIGDFVLAVGSPFGLSQSVTYGIISAKGRRDLELGMVRVRLQDFLQTDAAINPGNSGGPLINLRGEVIGINTAIASNSGGNEGIGFSIPVNLVKIVARQLVERGRVQRAFLGVTMDSKFTPDAAVRLGLSSRYGVRVTDVQPGTPASNADILKGDVIVEFDGKRVEDDDHLSYLVSLTEIGKEVPIRLLRDGQVHVVRVRVGDFNEFNDTDY